MTDGNEAIVVIGTARHPSLVDTIGEARRRHDTVIVLTDEADLVHHDHGSVSIIEPEHLLDRGITPIEDLWDRAAQEWLRKIFPGELSGVPLWELLWVTALRQPSLVDRIFEVALAHEFFRRIRPRAIFTVGEPPALCSLVAENARRREIPVFDRAVGSVNRERSALWYGFVESAALLTWHTLKAVRRTTVRRRSRRLIRGQHRPRIWAAISSEWRQSSRHVIEALLRPLQEEGIPFGIALAHTFGDVPDSSLASDVLAGLEPSAIDQISGPEDFATLLQTLARWLPLSVQSCIRALRHVNEFNVDGLSVSAAGDRRGVLSTATNGLLCVFEAQAATAQWLRGAGNNAKVVVFGLAASSEAKMADKSMQQCGITTIDFVHCHVCEGDLRTTFRSVSNQLVAWTIPEMRRFERIRSNAQCVGGFMPRPCIGKAKLRTRPRILVATSYLPNNVAEVVRRNLKHARRLAVALSELTDQIRGRADVVLRLHPLEDRTIWSSLFAGRTAPTWSEEPLLANDLASADIMIATNSSVIIEAVMYGIPLLMHRGPVVEPDSPAGNISLRRSFTTGGQLIACVEAILEAPADIEPELALRRACFGASGEPKSVLSFVQGRDADAPSRSSWPRTAKC